METRDIVSVLVVITLATLMAVSIYTKFLMNNASFQPRKECNITYDSEQKIKLNYPQGYEGYYLYVKCPIIK